MTSIYINYTTAIINFNIFTYEYFDGYKYKGGKIMRLIAVSIVSGVLAMFLTSLLSLDGSTVGDGLYLIIGAIGFMCPGLYVLDKIYEDIKNKKSL